MTPDLSDIVRDDLVASSFEPHIGSPFALWAAGAAVPLILAAVTRTAGSDDSFALLFRTPEALAQGTYPVEHTAAGRMALFLVPVGRDAGGLLVEAVFNRAPRPTGP